MTAKTNATSEATSQSLGFPCGLALVCWPSPRLTCPVPQLATIIDMLEGAFYGLDLLKLHSVTSKLVGRVDKLEEVRSMLGLCVFLLTKPKVYKTSQYFDRRHIAGDQENQ